MEYLIALGLATILGFIVSRTPKAIPLKIKNRR